MSEQQQSDGAMAPGGIARLEFGPGPYHGGCCTDHSSIFRDCDGSSIGKFFQQCATESGSHDLTDLLNAAETLAQKRGAIAEGEEFQRQVIASAVARAMGWRLELAEDRKARLAEDRPWSTNQWV